MADNSVDAIVTDPPYELGFMGKSWDSTGVAYDVAVWQECLRVLKPGGHLLAFGGSRTYHRLAVAIEDAGFQIRDQIMWVYGSGFPKSLNISKAIDKDAGAEREIVGVGQSGKTAIWNEDGGMGKFDITAPATNEAKQWDGWGTALKPAHEPIVMARKPLDGTVAKNVLTHGVGGINIDGCRVGEGTGETKTVQYPDIRGNNYNNASGTVEYTVTNQGRFPANFIHDGSDEVLELFPDDVKGQFGGKGRAANSKSGKYNWNNSSHEINNKGATAGIFDNGSAARFFYCAKASKKDRNEGLDDFPLVKGGSMNGAETRPDKPTNHPIRANHHPTVKPTDLMRYLCRLITPPDGIVLDPFTGSGSTGKAATLEGFTFIGIEQSVEYAEIANARINHAKETK
jgi:site-specific DNA-methyltransferase (adenine-specific)